MNGATPPVTWKVVYQNEGYDSTPGAPIVRGATVGILVNDSIQGSAFVPASALGKQAGWDILNAEAEKLAATSSWTHQNAPGG